MIPEHANFDQKASGIIMLINKTKSIVFIFFKWLFVILLYFGCWYMVKCCILFLSAVTIWKQFDVLYKYFMWKMQRTIVSMYRWQDIKIPWFMNVMCLQMLLFLTIVREIYRRTDGKYRNLTAKLKACQRGITLSRHFTIQNQLSRIYHVLQSILTQFH